MDAAQTADPSFSPIMAPARAKTYGDYFAGGTSTNIKGLNTLPHHLEDLAKAVDQFPMWGALGPLNKIANALTGGYLEQSQDPNYLGAKQKVLAVSTEMAKAFRGAGAMSEKEIGDWLQQLRIASSPAAIKELIGSGVNLAAGRLDAVQSHWDKTMGPNNPLEVMDPSAQAAWDRILKWTRGEIPGKDLKPSTTGKGSAAAPAPAAAAPQLPKITNRDQANTAIGAAREAVKSGRWTTEQANDALRKMGAPPLAGP